MMESFLKKKIKEVKEMQEIYLEGLDYVRTYIIWILDNHKKYHIPIEEIDKLVSLYKKSSNILDKNSPTESQQRNKTPDDETEPDFIIKLINYQ